MIAAFFIATTGLVSSCTKDSVKPTQKTVVADKTDVGQGDYTGDTTPTPPPTPGGAQ
ncbi:hypothetical protein BDD43_4179 [Mucilaginibacter gracilis]|uniref:Uncharacterized protein n=2 Tax=Mucilaginibacter gracilis TaxID=423350 RepID=A0A495J6G4_9SPHI|nr:hypothetical protein BDD43_4179 [Mucilaginibacter gracilis]